jgi:nucleotide-binding universal stress UspA family protein
MTSVMFKPEADQAAAPQAVAPFSGKGEVKSVLLHVQDDAGLDARLQAALAIVRASGGHLACMHVTPLSNYVGYETYGGAYVLTELLKQLDEQDAAMRVRIEARLANEDVSWSYERQTADPASALVYAGALADLIVVGRDDPNRDSAYRHMAMFGGILAATHTPVLICSKDGKQFDPFGMAVVAWNDSFEAANALRAALPLLKQASAVHILTIDEDKDRDFPPLGASEYLSRHGVHAELISESRGTLSINDKLVASAQSLGASYLVMGAYGHHRVREYLFGGVTRSLLQECPLPLVLAR